jgi:transcription elongation factor SPT6
LKDRGIGEVIIRPSTKGANYLSITWAFQEGWFKHIEVEEKDKRPGDQGLGRVLIVKVIILSYPTLSHHYF